MQRFALPLAIVVLSTAVAAQSPTVSFLFDGLGTPGNAFNLGTNLPGDYALTGLDLSGTGTSGTGLTGVAGTGENLASPLDASDFNGDWTLSFAINTASSFFAGGGTTTNFQYVFGGTTSSSFRVFCGGAAGAGNIILRGNGVTDVTIPGGAGDRGFVLVTWTYDATASVINGYLDGVLAVSVPQASPLAFPADPVTIGAYGGSTDSLEPGDVMDIFEAYDVALTPAQVAALATAAGAPFPQAPRPAPQWQTNSAKLSTTLGGIGATATGPGRVTTVLDRAAPVIPTLDITSGLAGAPFELAFTLGAPAVPLSGGGLEIGAGTSLPQTLNIDLTAPALFLNNLTFPPLPGPISLPLNLPSGTLAAAQAAIIDPTAPSGFTFSGAVEGNWVNTPGTPTPPGTAIVVDALGANSFNGDASSGFWQVSHTGALPVAIVSVTFDMNAAAPGTTASGMLFDTDQTGMADRFDGGNSTVAGTLGTYRNGTDLTTGLIYDAANTPTLNTLDPTANTGWIGTNPGTASTFGTIQFRFAPAQFLAGEAFSFDADTDGGIGSNGGAMDGIVVTIVVEDGAGTQTTLSGTMTLDPLEPTRAVLFL